MLLLNSLLASRSMITRRVHIHANKVLWMSRVKHWGSPCASNTSVKVTELQTYTFLTITPSESPGTDSSSLRPGQPGTNHVMSECPERQSGQIVPNLNTDESLLNAAKGSKWESKEINFLQELREK